MVRRKRGRLRTTRYDAVENWGKTTHTRTHTHTLEQPGVKAPGTPKRMPFFPAKSSVTLTWWRGRKVVCVSTVGGVISDIEKFYPSLSFTTFIL